MSERNGNIIAAIVCGLIFVLLLAALPPHDQGNPQQTQTEQTLAETEGPSARLVNDAYKNPDLDKPCDQGADHRESDLCAQWKAADAAKESADWTRRSLYIAAGGLLISILTLGAAAAAAVYAGKAANFTRTGAEAAEASVIQARRSADASVNTLHATRAWICQIGYETSPVRDTHSAGERVANGYAFSVRWSNFGGSPAVNVSASSILYTTQFDDEAELSRIQEEAKSLVFDNQGFVGVIGPGKSFSGMLHFVDDKKSRQFEDYQLRVFIFGYVFYDDIFDTTQRRHSQVFAELANAGWQRDREGNLVLATHFLPVGPLNTVT